jgi:hypothetical protein
MVHKLENGMVRCLLGVLVVTAGLAALASVAYASFSPEREALPSEGNRLRKTEVAAPSGSRLTLFRAIPALDICFSLN